MENNNNVNTSPETQVQEEQAQPKTYTEQEVQSMIDRRVTEAMKTAERKTNAKIKEAEKLAQMNEQEKYEYQLQQREAAIAAKEKELALAENKVEASKILSERGLPVGLIDLVVAEDAEAMAANIKTLETAFNDALRKAVEGRLASKTPRHTVVNEQAIDRKTFLKMSVAELTELRQNNPDLFAQLSNS